MKERPILFTPGNVLAILKSRKNQTRRTCKFRITGPNPPDQELFDMYDGEKWVGAFSKGQSSLSSAAANCPYGLPGDRLWVRESFLVRAAGASVVYKASVVDEHGAPEAAGFGAMYGGWKSPLFMPRKLARLILEITEVRIELVQDISEADAKAEGVTVSDKVTMKDGSPCYSANYRILWGQINGDYNPNSWDSNPWVWCLSFRQLSS